MPTYTIELPDGRRMTVESSSPENAQKGAQEWFKANPKPAGKPEQKRLDNAPRVPFYIDDQAGNEVNLNAPEYEDAKAALRQENYSREEGEKARLADRGIGQRIADTATFGLSMIPRTVTGGQYGLGDIFGLANERAGINTKLSEQDFAKANPGFMNAMQWLGEMSMAVPGGSALGNVPKGMQTAARFANASPRGTLASAIRGTGETMAKYSGTPGAVAGSESAFRLPTAVGRAGRGLQSYADSIQPYTPKPPKTKQSTPATAGLPENIQTLPERLRDIQAFREEEVPQFPPSTGSKGTAMAAKTLENMPLIGGTVKSPKTNTELTFKQRQAGLASQLGDLGDQEATGAMVQSALERYRTKGLTELDPSAVKAQGITPYQPQKAAQVLTEGAAKSMKEAAPIRAAEGGGTATTNRGVEVPTAKPLNQIGLRRTNVEDLSDAQVAALVKKPSADTSFAARTEALYESAWRKIPGLMRKDKSANANRVGWLNLQNALKQTQGEIGSQISGQNTLTGQLAQRILTAKSHTSIGELRAIRTELGRALSNFGTFETSLDRSQINRLYGAASRDMEAGLQSIANRAWERTKITGPNKTTVEQAKAADGALYEFRRADRYFRQGMERMGKFMDVLQAKTPNEAAKKVTRALAENTANPGMLRSIMTTLRPEELNSLRGHIIASLGEGRPGGKAAETIMSWHNWGTDMNKIMSTKVGREFMTKGLPEGAARRLENLARMANRMKYYEQTTNFSASGYTTLIGLGAYSMFNPIGAAKLIAVGSLAGLGGKLLTSPAYLAFSENLMKAQLKAGNTAASNARILAAYAKRLPAMANAQKARDPELGQAFKGLAIAIDEQLKRDEQKARALPAPKP